MSTYTPTRFSVQTGLDERGYRLGLYRFPEEDIVRFRRRLLLEARQPSGPSAKEFHRSISRKVGEFDDVVGNIVIRDEASPTDPRLIITPARLLLYSDFSNDVIDTEINLIDQDVVGYYLGEVATAIATSTVFDWVWNVDSTDYEYARSKYFLVGDNVRVSRFRTLPDNFVFVMSREQRGVPRRIWATNPIVFQTQVASADLISDDGDFALEYDTDFNIVVTTAVPMRGASIDIEWTAWPAEIRLASVRSWAYNDADAELFLKDSALGDDTTTEAVPSHLNAVGAEIAQVVLATAPIEWGD